MGSACTLYWLCTYIAVHGLLCHQLALAVVPCTALILHTLGVISRCMYGRHVRSKSSALSVDYTMISIAQWSQDTHRTISTAQRVMKAEPMSSKPERQRITGQYTSMRDHQWNGQPPPPTCPLQSRRGRRGLDA